MKNNSINNVLSINIVLAEEKVQTVFRVRVKGFFSFNIPGLTCAIKTFGNESFCVSIVGRMDIWNGDAAPIGKLGV